MEAQQAAMMQSMMQQGMNPMAMQMAMMQQMGHMGMAHPAYMQMMQQQMMNSKAGGKAGGKQDDEGSSSESGDSSSSSSDSGPAAGGFNPAAAMAAMAAMNPAMSHWPASASAGPPPQADYKPPPHRPGMPPPPPPPPPPGGYGMLPPPIPGGATDADVDADVEAYLKDNPVNEEAADRLKCLPPHLQVAVMKRGTLTDNRNPSGTLIAWVRDAEVGRPDGRGEGHMKKEIAPAGGGDSMPARKSVKQAIEAMINDFRLEVNVSWTMRALAPDKQKLAAKIDPSGQPDPSAYVAEQLKSIV